MAGKSPTEPSIKPGEWNVPAVARTLRAAARRWRLERENAQLRGDLLTLAHRISHDLRSPLTGIVSAAEVLKDGLEEKDRDLLNHLFDGAKELGKTIASFSIVDESIGLPAALRGCGHGIGHFASSVQRSEQQLLRRQIRVEASATFPRCYRSLGLGRGDLARTPVECRALRPRTAAPSLSVGARKALSSASGSTTRVNRCPRKNAQSCFNHFTRSIKSMPVEGWDCPWSSVSWNSRAARSATSRLPKVALFFSSRCQKSNQRCRLLTVQITFPRRARSPPPNPAKPGVSGRPPSQPTLEWEGDSSDRPPPSKGMAHDKNALKLARQTEMYL